jgi:hypothetical protein
MLLSVSMDAKRSTDMAGLVWSSTMAELPALKRAIRAEAEAKIEAEAKECREVAARAIHDALKAGASKASLRKVTTKDHWGFEAYVDLGEELARRDKKK